MKNRMRYFGLIYLTGWLYMFLFVMVNRLGALSYRSFPGNILLTAFGLLPMIMVYCLWKTDGKVSNVKDYLKLVLHTERVLVAVIGTVIVVAFHMGAVLLLSKRPTTCYGLTWVTFLYTALVSSLQEIGWRGQRLVDVPEAGLSPYIEPTITGVFWAFWYLPVLMLPGMDWTKDELVLFLLYHVFLSIVLSALRKLSGCIWSCVVFRFASVVLTLLVPEFCFGNNHLVILYMVEFAVSLVYLMHGSYNTEEDELEKGEEHKESLSETSLE